MVNGSHDDFMVLMPHTFDDVCMQSLHFASVHSEYHGVSTDQDVDDLMEIKTA